MKRISVIFVLLLWTSVHSNVNAQCSASNTAFQEGEVLNYNLFFNWKFIWLKAGTASLKTTLIKWDGKEAYSCNLITQTSKRLDKFFMMRDTLQSILQKDLVPLYYKKAANEGGKYYVDEVRYSYENGSVKLKHKYRSRKGDVTFSESSMTQCVYDMVSMMMRARSFNPEQFKVGEKLIFPMADGRKVEDITLIYRGKKTYKMKGTKDSYHCLVFSFIEYEKNEEKEIITFYITDDKNHIPVRLDMFLKFGTAKAYLNNYQGLRNTVLSVINEK